MTTSRIHAPEICNKNPGSHSDPELRKEAMSSTRAHTYILAALKRAGWEIDDLQPDRIEASDGERYGVAVFFESGVPVALEYGDGEHDLQHAESWDEAPGILAPAEVAQLFSDEEGEER